MTEYKRPMQVDTTRYEQSVEILEALSTTDEYFKEEKPEDPLVLVVEALLSTLPDDEKAVVEMCIMSRISMHEAARMLGFINSSGKEDHKMVYRRLQWALRKLRDTLESPSFALAMTGHKLPIELPPVVVKQKLSEVIAQLEKQLEENQDDN